MLANPQKTLVTVDSETLRFVYIGVSETVEIKSLEIEMDKECICKNRIDVFLILWFPKSFGHYVLLHKPKINT